MEGARADGLDVAIACDPSLEGTLGAVGLGYLAHADEDSVRLVLREACQPRLDETVVEAPLDSADDLVALARRVYRGFERHVSEGCRRRRGGLCPANCVGACARRLVLAAAADDPLMPEAIHRYLRLGFDAGPEARRLVTDRRVVAVGDLARFVINECERTRQFARFSLLADGSLIAVFRPRARTLPLTAGHFSARMASERFCLVDPVHRQALFHDPGRLRGRGGTVLMGLDQEGADRLAGTRDLAADEPYVRAMWRRFYEGLALPGRDPSQRGYDLRAGWMPKRLWGGLTEMDPASLDSGPAPERYQG